MVKLKELLALAQDAHDQENYFEETELLKQAVKLSPSGKDSAFIYEKLGNSLYLQGRSEEAKQYYFLALENLSNIPQNEAEEYIWLINDYLGAVFHDDGDYENALLYKLKAYESIEHLEPEDAFMLLTAIGVNHEKLQDYDSAIDFYLKALEIPDTSDEDKLMILRFLGQCYDKKGEDRKAFEYYHNLFVMDQAYDDGGWYLTYRFAQLSYRFGNYDDSITYFKKIIPQIPTDQIDYLQSSYQLLGYNYLAKKEFELALNELMKASKLKTDSSDKYGYIYCGIAQAYFGLDKINKTIRFGLKALDERLDEVIQEKVYYLLAYSYFLKRNDKEAKAYFENLRSLKPDSGYLRELERDFVNIEG